MGRDDFQIYAQGICSMSVCTSLKSRKKIEELANLYNPTGISSRWEISKDRTFHTGQSNPCPCEQRKGYKHYLLNC